MEKLINTQQACEVLGVCRVTLYRLIRNGRLKAHLVAKSWRFRQTDIEAFLRSVEVSR